jgi:biopolymer transport protein ExbD
MAMTVGPAESGDDGLNSTINTTPLVDVMLVLLIIFLITVPVITKTVPVKLPEQINIPTQTKPENIVIAIDKDGRTFWNDGYVPDYNTLLEYIKQANLRADAAHKALPEVHIRADRRVRYEYVGRVVVLCQRGGTQKIGFILEPPMPGAG